MKVTIIGAGIGGLATGIALNKKGIEFEIFEAAPALTAAGAGLGLASNAMKAFEKLDIAGEVKAVGKVLASFSIYDDKGKLITRTKAALPGDKPGAGNFTIHRAALQEVLLSHVAAGAIHLGKKAIGVQASGNTSIVRFSDGTEKCADLVIVADGIHSNIRQQFWTDAKPVYAGYTCWRAVIKNHHWNILECSETWGKKGRFGIVPLGSGELYWFACVNSSENNSRSRHFTINDLYEYFKSFHDPIPEIIRSTVDDQLLWNDIIYLKPLKKYVKGNLVLLGDAAHATTPNMGQGACQALEDAVVLADELSQVMQGNATLSIALNKYEKRRLKRTHMIINRSSQLGNIAQLENKLLIRLRNGLLRSIPPHLNEKQQAALYEVDF
jgi:2-polyprenyl-6-methoxyphenol hydroxylase-like FAD-dependent oxidoreductase